VQKSNELKPGNKMTDSKIELWNEAEVANLLTQKQSAHSSHKKISIKSSKENLQQSTTKASKLTTMTNKSSVSIDKNIEENKNRLIQLFKDFKLNPNLSPLLNQLKLSENFVADMNQPQTPVFYRRKLPNPPPVTPLGMV
jgi:hypothetical protein